MPKLSIQNIVETFNNLDLGIKVVYTRRKSSLDITVIDPLVLEVAIIYRLMLHMFFLELKTGDTCLSINSKEIIDKKHSIVVGSYELNRDPKLMNQLKSLGRFVFDVKEMSKVDYFTNNDQRIAINSDSEEHFDAFSCTGKSGVPKYNFVVKFKNISNDRIHIRMGVGLNYNFVEDNYKNENKEWKIYDIVKK